MLSCGNSKEAANNVNTQEPTTKTQEPMTDNKVTQPSEEFEIILQEAYGGLEKSEQRVITDTEGLQEIYGIINRFRRPGLPVPEVDFKSYVVVALFMGEKPNGGFSTEVQSISTANDRLIVNITEIGPKPTDNVTMAICQPFCFVKIPRPDEGKKIVFERVN